MIGVAVAGIEQKMPPVGYKHINGRVSRAGASQRSSPIDIPTSSQILLALRPPLLPLLGERGGEGPTRMPSESLARLAAVDHLIDDQGVDERAELGAHRL